MDYTKEKLKQLREDWKNHPEHRFKIELMARTLKMKPFKEKPTEFHNDIKDALL